MFVFHVCPHHNLCSLQSSVRHIGSWNCPRVMHKSKYTYILVSYMRRLTPRNAWTNEASWIYTICQFNVANWTTLIPTTISLQGNPEHKRDIIPGKPLALMVQRPSANLAILWSLHNLFWSKWMITPLDQLHWLSQIVHVTIQSFTLQ